MDINWYIFNRCNQLPQRWSAEWLRRDIAVAAHLVGKPRRTMATTTTASSLQRIKEAMDLLSLPSEYRQLDCFHGSVTDVWIRDGSTFIYNNTFGGFWASTPFDDSARVRNDTPPLSEQWDFSTDLIQCVLPAWRYALDARTLD